jgi:hypothetical protein
MVSYFYWFVAIAAALFVGWGLTRFLKWQIGAVTGFVIIVMAWLAYHFYYEQSFVKHYGGIMSVKVPEGQMHLSATWKDDHLWIENYDPKSNTCYFSEYSKSHLLQGEVSIENCNPIVTPNAMSDVTKP